MSDGHVIDEMLFRREVVRLRDQQPFGSERWKDLDKRVWASFRRELRDAKRRAAP